MRNNSSGSSRNEILLNVYEDQYTGRFGITKDGDTVFFEESPPVFGENGKIVKPAIWEPSDVNLTMKSSPVATAIVAVALDGNGFEQLRYSSKRSRRKNR